MTTEVGVAGVSDVTRRKEHGLRDWKTHPTYKLYLDMISLLHKYRKPFRDNRMPSKLTREAFMKLIKQSNRQVFVDRWKSLEEGFHSWFTYESLYSWTYNLALNPDVSLEDAFKFLRLVEVYRMEPGSGLSHPDTDVDNLLHNLRYAFRRESGGKVFIPSASKLASILEMSYGESGHSSPFDFSREREWKHSKLHELLYALYKKGKTYNRRGSANFILKNLGILSPDGFYENRRYPLMDNSIKEALAAVSKYTVVKKWDNIFDPNPVQELIMVLRWFLSDHRGGYVSNDEFAQFFDIPKVSLLNYIYGTRRYIQDITPFEDAVREIKGYIDGSMQRYLDNLFREAKGFTEDSDLISRVTSRAHSGYESVSNRLMNFFGIPSIHERDLPNGFIPDNLIERIQEGETEGNSIFIEAIENNQKVIQKWRLVGHKWVCIDYTISPDERYLRDKCRKYSNKNSFLIIVLYGKHSETTIDKAKDIVSDYDHAELLTPDEYKEFLGLIPSEDHNEEQREFLNDLLAEYNVISESTINAFSRSRVISDTALHALATLRNQALLDLKNHEDRWREHFNTRFLGNHDWD